MHTENMSTYQHLIQAGMEAEQATACVKVVEELVDAKIVERLNHHRELLSIEMHTAAANSRYTLYGDIGGVAIILLSTFCFALISRMPIH
jgi:hypothetical protein